MFNFWSWSVGKELILVIGQNITVVFLGIVGPDTVKVMIINRLHLHSGYYAPDTAPSIYMYKLIYPLLWTACTVIIPILRIFICSWKKPNREVEKSMECGAGASFYFRFCWPTCFLHHGQVHFDQNLKPNYPMQWVYMVRVYIGKCYIIWGS